ncbi:MAG: zinc ribbon domain-containing protein [Clostridiaceae bacterium]|nr:zinc ribbon domain-containing protein [Clostridiaceae bacterium]
MSLFEQISKKVGEAAQVAAKKSGELVEIAKLNMNIVAEEDKIKNIYLKIGENTYAKYRSGNEIDADFIADCEKIMEYQKVLDGLKAKIREIKNMKLCTSCGEEVQDNALFCPKCGAKLEKTDSQQEQAE